MRRETRVQLIAGVVLLGALALAGAFAVALAASTGRHRLVHTDTAEEGQPPQVAAGIAMGAFRGLFVNVLWIRANNLKEEGRYYEAMDLARAITHLQPRFPHVWVFHAWNMAYNISVNCQTPGERWRWVNAGIRLLRDQGIPANPNDLLIHKELAWIFLHKIGGWMDDANIYYKREFAAEWTLALGPPPRFDPRDRDFAAATEKYAAWLEPIVAAPDSSQDLVRVHPQVRDLVAQLRREHGLEPGPDLARMYTVARAIADSSSRALFERDMPEDEKRFLVLVSDPQCADAWPPLIAFLRKRLLIDEYHMEPERMLRYTREFGPLDWRHPAAHALYWGQRGIEHALVRYTAANKRDFDFVNSGRIVVHALQELWRWGDIYFDFLGYIRARGDERLKAQVFLRGSPNVHFIDSYGQHLDRYVGMSWADQRRRVYTLYAAGYENFMKDAIRFLYRRGEIARAAQLKDRLAHWPHANLHDPERSERLALPLDEFVKKELEDELTRPSVAREEVVGALEGAYLSGLLGNNPELFRRQFEYAAMVHKFFFEQQGRRTAVDPNIFRLAQMERDFRVLAGLEFAALIARLDLEQAEALYDAAPLDLRPYGYDVVREHFQAMLDEGARSGGRPFAQVFPEPPGMEEFRQVMRQRQERLHRPAVELK